MIERGDLKMGKASNLSRGVCLHIQESSKIRKE